MLGSKWQNITRPTYVPSNNFTDFWIFHLLYYKSQCPQYLLWIFIEFLKIKYSQIEGHRDSHRIILIIAFLKCMNYLTNTSLTQLEQKLNKRAELN